MRILLCDDHRLFVEALATSLRGRGEDVVAAVGDPEDAVTLAAQLDVDVCLVDVHFPGGDSFAAVRRILQSGGRTSVVVLSADNDREVISAALTSGATGFVLKRASVDVILEVAQRVHAGELVVRTEGGPCRPQRAVTRARPPALVEPLTEREREVLARLVMGEETAVIARRLGIRTSTARTHIQNVIGKLGVHTKVAAVAYAIGCGMVPLCPADLQSSIRGANGTAPAPPALGRLAAS